MTLIRICPSYAIEVFWGWGRSGGGGLRRPCQAPTLGSLAAAARLPYHPLPLHSPFNLATCGGHSPENVAAADLGEPAGGAAGSAAAAVWAIRKRFAGDCGSVDSVRPAAGGIHSHH